MLQISWISVCVWKSGSNFCILLLYVDDILLTENDSDMLSQTKNWSSANFEMRDTGEATYILGIKNSRDKKLKALYLNQKKYIEHILTKFGMKDSKPVGTPIAKGASLSKNDCPSENQ